MSDVILQVGTDDLLYELSQCREDERASKAQIFQLLTTTATFLTIVTTISGALSSSDTQTALGWELYMFLYLLTILVVSAAVSYIANLGLLSTFRHHYMVDLERQLKLVSLLHWETVSKPVITMNPKHIGTGIFFLFGFNARIALVSVLALALVFIIMQVTIILELFPQLAAVTWCGFIFYVLVLLTCVITLVISMYRSNELYRRAYKKATAQNLVRPELKGGIISYYLYPRLKDVQKILFIILGYAMGYVLPYLDGATHPSLWEEIPNLLITLLIVDGLVYQARYLWNDIRGAHEDQAHPSAGARKRLPVEDLGLKQAVYIGLAAMGLRLVAAAICIFLLDPTKRLPMATVCILVLVIGASYEAARAKGVAPQTIFLVCLGYPLRWAAGLWCACPDLIGLIREKPELFLPLLILFFSIGFFGGAFVTMTWVLEATHIYQKEETIKKPHLLYLFEMLDPSQQRSEYPLRQCCTQKCIWNRFYLFSIFFLTASALLLFFPSRIKSIVTVLSGLCCLIPLMLKRRTKASLVIMIGALLSFWGITLLNIDFTPAWTLFFLIELLQLVYFGIYVSFCYSNYILLYSLFEKICNKLFSLAKELEPLVWDLLVGRKTMEVLEKEKSETASKSEK